MMRWLPFGVVLALIHMPHSATAAETAPTAAAQKLVQVTPAAGQGRLLNPFTDEARSDWHYTPRQRAGIAWKEMSAEQQAAATELLRTALTAKGLDKVRAVMALEIALREIEGRPSRDPENYAIAIFGRPGKEPWGWRLEGHHLSLHWTLRGDDYVSSLPQFFGANPARAPRDFGKEIRAGSRVLGAEEDRGFILLRSLTPEQRKLAVFDDGPYGDILTRNAAKVSPLEPKGIEFAKLGPEQQALLLSLVSAFAEHLNPPLAEPRLARVRAGGLEKVRFGWAGAAEPGQPYYFRIQGPAFLIEFDNSGGNHIHSAWRDFDGDWGRDALGEHYRTSGPDHGHAGR